MKGPLELIAFVLVFTTVFMALIISKSRVNSPNIMPHNAIFYGLASAQYCNHPVTSLFAARSVIVAHHIGLATGTYLQPGFCNTVQNHFLPSTNI